jgi:hypothetical protein
MLKDQLVYLIFFEVCISVYCILYVKVFIRIVIVDVVC